MFVEIATTLLRVIELLVPIFLIIGCSVVVFGVVEFFTTSGDEVSKKEGKKIIISGSVLILLTLFFWLLQFFVATH